MAATLKAGWVMPEPPVLGALASYYLDGGECYLSWNNADREPATQGPESEIAWPFGPDDIASRSELEALGFRDAEE